MEINKEVLTNKYDELRQHCWNQAVNAFATAYIFDLKSKNLVKKLRLLTFLGLLIPLATGGVILLFEVNNRFLLNFLVWITGGLSLVHASITLWSLVEKWEDNISYARESSRHNYRISDNYVFLARIVPTDFEVRLEILENENRFRMDLDYQQDITEEEKRRGLRAALRQFERPCAKCKEVPYSMEPTDCSVCGNFKRGEQL